MADDLSQIRQELDDIAKKAQESTRSIAALREELEQLIRASTRGGEPTSAGISGLVQRAKTAGGAENLPQRTRAGGGSYLSMEEATRKKVIDALNNYIQALNTASNLVDREKELRRKEEALISLSNLNKTPSKGLSDAILGKRNEPENQRKTIDEQEEERKKQLVYAQDTSYLWKEILNSIELESSTLKKDVGDFTKLIKARLQAEQDIVDNTRKYQKELETQRQKELAELQAAITKRIQAEQAQLVKDKDVQIKQDLAGVAQNDIFRQANIAEQTKEQAQAYKDIADQQKYQKAAEKDYYDFVNAQQKELLRLKLEEVDIGLRQQAQNELLAKALEEQVRQQERFTQLQQTNPVAAQAAAQKGFTPDKEGFKVSSTEEVSTGIKRTTFQYQELDGQIKRLTITQDKYNKILDDTQKRFRTLGSAIVRDITEVFKWSIAVAVVYGPLKKLQELTQTMIQNEAELVNIAVTLGQSHRDLDNIFTSAARAATATGESIDGVLEGYVLAYRAAGRYTDAQTRATVAEKLLKDSLVLSKLSALDQAQALDTLVGALQQLGYSLVDGDKLLNKWVAVSKAANVGVETLAESFAITATSATSANIDVDKLNGIIAVMAENTTLSATEAGNAVRGFISGFQTDTAQKALKDLGIATETVGGQARDFVSIMEELSALSASGLISPQKLSEVASAIGGGARRGPQVEAIIKNLGRANDLAQVSANATTDAYDALGEKLDTVQTSITNLGNAFQKLAQTLGSEGGILSSFQSIVDLATNMVDALTKVVETMGKATPVIIGTIGALAFAQSNPARISQFLGTNSSLYRGSFGQNAYGVPGGNIGPATRGQAELNATVKNFGNIALSIAALIPQFLELARRDRGGENVLPQYGGFALGGLIGGALGGPIGATIGATIGTSFVDAVLKHENDFEAFFTPIFKNAMGEGVKASRETPQETASRLAFEQLGGGSQQLGHMLANIGSFITGGALAVNPGQGRQFEGITPEQYALAFGGIGNQQFYQDASGLEKSILGLTAVITSILFPQKYQKVYSNQNTLQNIQGARQQQFPFGNEELGITTPFSEQTANIQKDNAVTIQKIIEEQQAKIAEALQKQEISSKDYLEKSKQLETGGLAILRVYQAFPDVFRNAAEGINYISSVLFQANADQTGYITSLTSAIADLDNKIAQLKSEGATQIEIQAVLDEKSNIQEELKNFVEGVNRQQILNNIKLTPIVDVDATQQEFQLILQEALRFQESYFDAMKLTPEAAKELADSYEPFFAYLGGKFIEVTGLAQENFTRAISTLSDQGKISGGKSSYTVQTIDANKQAFITAYAIKKAFVEANFPQYQVKETPGGQIFKDGIGTLHLDNLITQLALQDLIDVNEKQLDGIYNLPSGADFFVPIQTLQYAYNAGANSVSGGGGATDFKGGIKGTSETVSPELVRKNQDIRTERKDQQVEELLLEMSKAVIATKKPQEPTKVEIDPKIFKPSLNPYSTYDYPKMFDSNDINELKSMAKSQDFVKPVETKLSLEMNSNVQLTVDGRALATVIKQYLYEDLLRYEGVGGSITRRIVL